MKKILLLSLLFLGCSTNETEVDLSVDLTDSVLVKSQENLTKASEINKQGDSSITGKVEKTAQKIEVMEKQITKLKQENNELKTKLNDANDAGEPFELLPVSDY